MSTSFFDDDDEGNFDVDANRPAAGPAPALRRSGGEDDHDEIQLPPPLKDRYQAAQAAGPSHQHAPITRRHRHQSSAAAMDLDVDDLVDDIIAPEAGLKGKGRGRQEDERENEVERLMRRWMDERMAPELLRCDEELMAAIMERLEAQTEAASLLSGATGTDSKGKGKGKKSSAELEEEHERILLVQMEIERVRYALRAYIRARTYKVEKFAQYLLRTPGAKQRMTDVEYGYAQRYQALVEKHFTQAVVQNLPDRLSRLDEPEMIVKPDLDQAVFACARRDCPPVRLPDGQMLEMRKGEVHMLRYRSVRRLLRDGDVRLV